MCKLLQDQTEVVAVNHQPRGGIVLEVHIKVRTILAPCGVAIAAAVRRAAPRREVIVVGELEELGEPVDCG